MAELDYRSVPQAPEGIGYLEELAFDLRNSWEHGADDIWRRLDPELWAATHNPRVVLQTVARTHLRDAWLTLNSSRCSRGWCSLGGGRRRHRHGSSAPIRKRPSVARLTSAWNSD